MRRSSRQPDLFAAEPPPVSDTCRPLGPGPQVVDAASRRLWLAVHLPDLSLAALPQTDAAPRAVLGQRARVLVCDADAAAQGVRPGLPANAALALLPGLVLQERDPAAEQRLLEELATLCLAFSPCVSLASEASLLLEIRGSLKLFGGTGPLHAQLQAAFAARGQVIATAIAPTARAAHWLACAGGGQVLTTASLAAALAGLPIAGLPWPDARQRQLLEMGVTELGACARLPRDGLARRFGPSLLLELDQAYGRRPEALQGYQPPQHFSETAELPEETTRLDSLCPPLQLLLEGLAGFMRRRQKSVQRIWLHCVYAGQPATRLCIGLLRPTSQVDHLFELAQLQLAELQLKAPVRALEVQAMLEDLPSPGSGELLPEETGSAANSLAFVERLRGRLGAQAVHGLQVLAEHRPEHAWRMVSEPGSDSALPGVPAAGQRPLWMRSQPLVLQEQQGRPLFQGYLQLSCGPERIETGWWDGGDVRRDYYVASNPRGMRLWVYRDLRDRRWYLHGIFG